MKDMEDPTIVKSDSVNNLYSNLEGSKQFGIILKKSKENLDDLLDSYDRNYLIPFLGAGSSEPLGIKTWKSFAIELNKSIEVNEIDAQDLEEDSLPKVFEKIYKKFIDENRESDYHSEIKRILTPTKVSSTSPLIKLILLFDRIITTNLDESVENAYALFETIHKALAVKTPLKSIHCNYLPNFDIAAPTPALYYLHGSINRSEKVLRETEYETYYVSTNTGMPKNEAIRNLLFNFYKDKSLMYLGFSFTDKYYKDFVRYIVKEIDRMKLATESLYNVHDSHEARKHFLLMSYSSFAKLFKQEINKEIENAEENEIEELFSQLENELRLKPVIYKRDLHIFYEFDRYTV